MLFEFLSDFLIRLAEIAAGFEPWQQAGFLVLFGAIPFVESYFGTFIGILVGVSPVLAVSAAVVGNVICTFALIAIASKTRQAVLRKRNGNGIAAPELTKRQRKVQTALNRYGVPGVCLFGPLVVASQITAPTLIALGARPAKVYLFQGISIVAWGVLFSLIGGALVTSITG